MICPDCLEDYEFVGFEVDAETLEHRGVFKCACTEELVFPEFLAVEMIEDDDILDRLKISRMHQVRLSLNKNRQMRVKSHKEFLAIKTRHLQKYIETFQEQALRQRK